jgi:hypothetical protein
MRKVQRVNRETNMPKHVTEIETHLLAIQLKKREAAQLELKKEPSRLTPYFLTVIPLLIPAIFPDQIANLLGLPPRATWFVAFVLTLIVYLSTEVAALRRQVKALHHLHNGDA